jgi:hypothetical protein
MLARAAASEVSMDEQHVCAPILRLVKSVRRVASVVGEHVVLEPLERDRLQVPRGDDAVGVDIVTAQRQGAACDTLDAADAHAVTP